MDDQQIIDGLGQIIDYLNDAKAVIDDTEVEDGFCEILDEAIRRIQK